MTERSSLGDYLAGSIYQWMVALKRNISDATGYIQSSLASIEATQTLLNECMAAPTVLLASSAGQTTFPVSGGYTAGSIQSVFLNGLRLLPSDYAATDGSNVVLNAALAPYVVVGSSLLINPTVLISSNPSVTSAQLAASGGASLIGYDTGTVSSTLATIAQQITALQNANAPIGTMHAFGGTTPPENYLMAQGQSFDSATYPELANVYPSLTLPDARGLAIRGYDPTGLNDFAGNGRAIGSFQEGSYIERNNYNGTALVQRQSVASATDYSTNTTYQMDTPTPGIAPASWDMSYVSRTSWASYTDMIQNARVTRMKNISQNWIVRAL